MKRLAAAVALVAVAVAVLILGRSSEPVRVTATGTHYAVTVVVDRQVVEVLVDSGDADAVAISAVMPEMGHAQPEVSARKTGLGRFVAEGERLPMSGVWELSVRLTGAAGEEVITVSALIAQ